MKAIKKIKRTILGLSLALVLVPLVGCSNDDKEPVEETHVEDDDKENNNQITTEEQIENDVLKVLGFSEEKDDIVRLGSEDEGSDDQSVTVNEKDGSFDLFMSVSKETTGIDSAGDGPMVGLTIAHDLKREKESIPKLEDISKELFKVISKYDYIEWIGINHELLTDEDSSKHSRALTINLEKETFDEIDWDNFDSSKLSTIADDYLLDEDLK